MTGSLTGRQRVAAVIIRDRHVLMVRERGKGPSGRHDGQEYWTLPGGGIEPGESPEDAVIREVAEETGLTGVSVRYVYDVPYPSGWTACYRMDVAPGEPHLGVDDGLACDCPRMTGLSWVPLPENPSNNAYMVPPLLMSTDHTG
ncbi:NUDIX hydrolase [Streptomyces sp. NPDC050149]|uniref:NUDIX hydrolase n=1 Tax=unclassified Streptomyces TaxID=2593676 RepID=UPI002E2EF7D0|nr:NUDIX hydrolase [Streptomyces sp. NBC_01358]WSW65714.1 NUDIX hydrolase [Streptomyces sp. NBC_00995]